MGRQVTLLAQARVASPFGVSHSKMRFELHSRYVLSGKTLKAPGSA